MTIHSGTDTAKRFFRALRSITHCYGPGPHDGRLEFCHIKPTTITPNGRGRGMWSRMNDIVKHPDCYIPLCANCHKTLDGKNRSTERYRHGRLAQMRKQKMSIIEKNVVKLFD